MTPVEEPNFQETQANPVISTTPPEIEPAFGWNSYAELVNGRFAMIGFAALLILELLTHQSFFQWLGLQ